MGPANAQDQLGHVAHSEDWDIFAGENGAKRVRRWVKQFGKNLNSDIKQGLYQEHALPSCVSCLVAVCPLVAFVDLQRVFPLPQKINVRAQQ